MSERIAVKVVVDTDELRDWAGRHADAGHHGVAHVLYAAAAEGESLTEQVIREAKAEAWDEGRRSAGICLPTDPPKSPTNPYCQEET